MSKCRDCGSKLNGYRPYMSDDLVIPPCPSCIGESRDVIRELHSLLCRPPAPGKLLEKRIGTKVAEGVDKAWSEWLEKQCPWLEKEEAGA